MKVWRKVKIKAWDDELCRGDIITVRLKNGEVHEAEVVDQKEVDGEKRSLVVFRNCLKDRRPMNEDGRTDGGYLESDLRKALNGEIYDMFPNKLKKRIIPDENGDKLFLLDLKTVGGIDDDWNRCEGQLPYFKDRRNRIALIAEEESYESAYWWLRDVVSASGFAFVVNGGHCNDASASYSFGVRPAFVI